VNVSSIIKVNCIARESDLGYKVNCKAREGALGYKVNCKARESDLGYKVNCIARERVTLVMKIQDGELIKAIDYPFFSLNTITSNGASEASEKGYNIFWRYDI